MYDVRAIANWFLARASKEGEHLTAMKLQKLAYVSHGWWLGFNGTPLVHDAVEAWKWGPVFRLLYQEFSEFGSTPITKRATAFDGATLVMREIGIDAYETPDPKVMGRFLESVWKAYGHYDAGELSDITHRDGTPWHQMLMKMERTIKPYTIIPNDLIRAHYEHLLRERTPS